MYSNAVTLILASQSPRRKQLIETLGFPVEVKVPTVKEYYPADIPLFEIPCFLASLKAEGFPASTIQPHEIIITADTLVFLGDTLLGKPKNETEAHAFLEALSGKEHTVITGVCLKSSSEKRIFSEKTLVRFRKLDQNEISYYINTFKPYDKAGGYGIQEWIGYIGIECINGCYYNVVGLPVQKVFSELKRMILSQNLFIKSC